MLTGKSIDCSYNENNLWKMPWSRPIFIHLFLIAVYCPESEDYKHHRTGYDHFTSFFFPVASALVSNSIIPESHCIGSLTISHEDSFSNIGHIALDGSYRGNYPNLKRGFPLLRRNAISHIEIFGNCCWKIYIDRKFQGENITIFPGRNVVYPEFQPVSIKKLQCPI